MEKKAGKGYKIALLSSIALILMFIIQKSGGLTGNAVGEVIPEMSNQYIIIILSLVGIIIVLAIIFVAALSKRKLSEKEYTEKRQEYRKEEIKKLEEDAKKLVFDARVNGYSDKEIAEMFMNKGWEKDDIDVILS